MKITSKTILLILVIFLLGTNLAVIITYQNHLKGEHAVAVKETIAVPDSRMGRFFRTELGLNEDQTGQFREFRQLYHHGANDVMGEMQEIRNEMIDVLNTKNPKRSKLDRLSNDLGEKHKELKALTFDYYFNMQSVLNEDQQGEMVVIFQSMLTDEGYAKTPSHTGDSHGKGHAHGEALNEEIQSADSCANEEVFEDFKEQ
jgi:Spy/CpxP family protein refolding chaperone